MQIVPFTELVVYELDLINMLQYVYLKYTITSEDLTSPSRFILDFSSIGSKIEFQNTSSLYGLRVYSLNNRFHKLASPYTGVWDTEAYSAQIGLHSSILTHAAGFTVQVGKGRKPPVCTDERGTNLTAMFFDVNLLGPCANADLNVQEIYLVVIQKTYENRRCCHFDGRITTNYSVPGNFILYLHQSGFSRPGLVNIWTFSHRESNAKFQVLCANLCFSIIIETFLDRSSLKRFSIRYHANLIQQNDFTMVTFTQMRFPFGVGPSKSGMMTWNQMCFNHRCYITPRRYKAATWDAAKTACEEKNASLVSINSDLEWALLTGLPRKKGEEFIELHNISSFILFYIGLVTDVSTC